MSDAVRIWALLGRRAGDNRQILTLARATGLSWTAKPLAFNRLSGLPTLLLGGTRATLTAATRTSLAAPWPDVVIAAGRRSTPAALWVQAASGGRARLVHLGRPWAPLDWFDLVVTTAQYRLASRPNVVLNRLPLTGPKALLNTAPDGDLLALPRPRLAVLVGGCSRPLVFDADAARKLAAEALARAAASGGALMVATAPRTPTEAVAALREAFAGASTPMKLSIWGEGPNRYGGFLAAADAFLVTDDSAAMVAEAAIAGAPVSLFVLPRRPDRRIRLVQAAEAWSERRSAARWLLEAGVGAGLISSLRDLDAYMRGLAQAGLLDGGDAARRCADRELATAANRVRSLCEARPA